MTRLRSFIQEIHRRSLWQVLGIYGAASWVVYEVIQALTEGLGLPDWFPAPALVLLLIGLPIVLATAFVQEGFSPTMLRDPTLLPDTEAGAPGARGDGGGVPRLLTWRKALAGGVLAFALWGVIAAGWLVLNGGVASPGGDSTSVAVLASKIRPLTGTQGLEAEPDYSPDGNSIVFVSEQSGNRDIWVLSLLSGEQVQISTDPAEDRHPAWSPDGRRIAFVSSRGHGLKLDRPALFGALTGGGIWTIPTFGGTPSPVVDGGFNPAWSPNGSRIAFDASRDGPRRIWVVSADGSNPIRVSDDAAPTSEHTQPSWSPDGRWIAYRRAGDVSDIQLVSTDGGTAVWITQDDARDFAPAWMPAGDMVVFASDRSGAINLWSVAVDPATGKPHGEPAQLTAGRGADLDPRVSPDGRAIVSASVRSVEDLWWVRTDPISGAWLEEPEPLLTSSWSDAAPAMSPDGKTVAFATDRRGSSDIWTLPTGGQGPIPLISGPGWDGAPSWSPDGKQIVFVSRRTGNDEIWVVRASGGPAVQLTDSSAEDQWPHWSPDATQIVFISDRAGQHDVMVMSVERGDARRLTNIGAEGHTPDWSPDGRWILFTSSWGGDRNVWAVSSDGEELRRITPEPTEEAHGLWTPDGSTVLYLTDHRSVRAVPFGGGTPVVLYDAGPGERVDDIDLSRDGTRLLFTFVRDEGDLWLIEGFK